MVIWDEKGDRITNGSTIGPMQERQMLNLTCVVKNTTPLPQVGWYRGNKRLTTGMYFVNISNIYRYYVLCFRNSCNKVIKNSYMSTS